MFARLAILSVILAVPVLAAEVEFGVYLPDGAHKVAEHRYKSPSDFEGTMKYFKTAYPPKDFPRKNIVNQPGVKALHLANPSGRGGWEGLNIYETGDDVRIYVVPVEGSGSKKRGKK